MATPQETSLGGVTERLPWCRVVHGVGAADPKSVMVAMRIGFTALPEHGTGLRRRGGLTL